MDLARFISLLVTESLYFACPSEFDDPYEGSLPRSHIRAESKLFQEKIDDVLLIRNKLAAKFPNSIDLHKVDEFLDNIVKDTPRLSKKCIFDVWNKLLAPE